MKVLASRSFWTCYALYLWMNTDVNHVYSRMRIYSFTAQVEKPFSFFFCGLWCLRDTIITPGVHIDEKKKSWMVNQQNQWGHFLPMPQQLPVSLPCSDPRGHSRYAQVWRRRPQFCIYFGHCWLGELFLGMNSSMLCCISLAEKGTTHASCGRRRGWALRQSETSIQAFLLCFVFWGLFLKHHL